MTDHRIVRWDLRSEGEKNTRRGGWIVLAFSSFSLKLEHRPEVPLLKWYSKLELQQRRSKRKREERHKAIYLGSFHKPEVVMSPLHFQGEFTKCNIWLQMLKHNCKRLLMLKNTIKRLLMLKHTSKRLLSNKITKKMFEIEYLIYNQWCSQYKSDTDS